MTAVVAAHTEMFGIDRGGGRGQGRAGRGAARRPAPRCSTPTTRGRGDGGAHRGRGASYYGTRAGCRRGRRATSRSTTSLRPRVPAADTPWGARRGARSPCAASTRSPTRWPPPAAALACGVRVADVAAGLARRRAVAVADGPAPHRVGAVVLNDAYNANPASMAAALRSLAALPAGRRIAVLGLMAELGDRRATPSTRRRRPGRRARHRRDRRRDRRPTACRPVRRTSTACWPRSAPLGDGDAVLVKGSRVAGLERVAAALSGGVRVTATGGRYGRRPVTATTWTPARVAPRRR